MHAYILLPPDLDVILSVLVSAVRKSLVWFHMAVIWSEIDRLRDFALFLI